MASKETNNENPEDSRDSAGGVGGMLKASRLRLGDDLRYVAETLHIRFIYLEAIEASRYEVLPGAAYAIGFIRSYANYLGLDSDEVVRRYKSESSGESGETRLVFPVPIPESSIPGGAIIFVGVIIALLTYGVWYVSTAKDGFLAGLVSPVPERLSEQSQQEQPKFTPEPTPEIAEPTPEVPEVADKEEITTPVEQVVAEIEKEVPQAADDAVEQAISEATLEAASVTAEVVEKVEETQQTVVAEVVEKVTKVAETSQAVAPEPEVSAIQPVVEPAASASEDVAASQPVAPDNTDSEPVVAQSADVQAPLKAVAEDPQPAPETPAEPVVETPAEPVAETPVETAVAETPEPAPVPTAVPATQVYGSENENSRILVKARKNSWIQVRDNNANRLLLTRLLRAGDSYRVPDQPGLVLLTGNAGALEILVDGKAVPDLGGPGKVRRNVTLDPDLLRQGNAAN